MVVTCVCNNLESILTGKRFVKHSSLLSLSAVMSLGNSWHTLCSVCSAGAACVCLCRCAVELVAQVSGVSFGNSPHHLGEVHVPRDPLLFRTVEVRTYIHTYIHTYVRTYIHTYVRTVQCMHVCVGCTHETHCSTQHHRDTIQFLELCLLCIVSLIRW